MKTKEQLDDMTISELEQESSKHWRYVRQIDALTNKKYKQQDKPYKDEHDKREVA